MFTHLGGSFDCVFLLMFFFKSSIFFIWVEVEVGESNLKNQFNDQDKNLVAMEGKPKKNPQFELD
jgi:hypothetical protein